MPQNTFEKEEVLPLVEERLHVSKESTIHRVRIATVKEARVTEEVVLKKNAENVTETVKDTVRKTEVDVQDDRTPGRKPLTPG